MSTSTDAPPRAAGSDAQRHRELVRARRRATLLLAAVVGVFLVTFALPDATWVGFVRATAEAAVVGGVADWFAVVALFRHPLGLPIPHTAVISRSKDGLGRNLATFVEEQLLDPTVVAARLRDADLAARAGGWLVQRDHADRVAGAVATTLATVLDGLDRDAVAADLADLAARGLAAMPVADLASQGLEAAIAQDQHQELLTAAIRGVRRAMDDHREVLRVRLGQESPWWVPDAVDDVVFERASDALDRFLGELAADPGHQLRSAVDDQLAELVVRLRTDPGVAAALDARVADLASRDDVQAWARTTAAHLVEALSSAALDDTSEVRDRLAIAITTLGDKLVGDPDLRARVDEWVRDLAPVVADASRREVSRIIADTVAGWDLEDTSGRLELWLGRDLQFVRINGTVVGGLVGLVLHTVVVVAGAA